MSGSEWIRRKTGIAGPHRAALTILLLITGLAVGQAQTPNVVAWGANFQGQTTVPASITDAKAIVAGGHHSLALNSDGTVVAWGSNNSGQTSVPPDLTNVAAIAAGVLHSLALKSDGTVVAWGNNQYGQSIVPANLTGVVAISTSAWHNVALKNDGTIVAWGANFSGQINVPSGLSGVVAVAAGSGHTVVLKSDGTVVDFGNGMSAPAGLSGVKTISAGALHSLALKDDGTVVAWGSNEFGETSVPTGLTNVAAIATGEYVNLALKTDGTVVAWGRNNWGQATVPAGLMGIAAISTGGGHALALKATLSPYNWGFYGDRINLPASLGNLVALNAGDDHTLVLKNDGTVAAWGVNSAGQTNVPAGLSDVVAVSGGYQSSAALKSDGTVLAWGTNSVPAGLTGVKAIDIYTGGAALKSNGTVAGWGVAGAAPAGLTDVKAVASGWAHHLALKADGTVVAWGQNYAGQLNVPGDLAGVRAISAGQAHNLALKADGTVVAWGFNDWGQATVPVGLTNVIAVAVGRDFSLALKSDGAVVIWGRSGNELSVPPGVKGVVVLDAGSFHAAALLSSPPPVMQVTIASSPAGRSFRVQQGQGCPSGSYTAPKTLTWIPGVACDVIFNASQNGTEPGTRWEFEKWADIEFYNPSRMIRPSELESTYTANFRLQYEVKLLSNPNFGGYAETDDFNHYYDPGSTVAITAYPSFGSEFVNWTGPVASASSASTTVTVNGPVTVTANFRILTTMYVEDVSGVNGSSVNLATQIQPYGPFAGSLQFKIQGVNAGAPIPIESGGYYTMPYTITQPAGVHAITAFLTVSTPGVLGSTGTASLTVTGRAQTVTFNPIPGQVAGASVSLSTYASATSGLAVNFASLTSAVCTVTGTTAKMLTAGTCTIQASQAGNGTYAAATPVSQNIVVSPGVVPNFTIKASPQTQTAFRDVLAAFLIELKSGNGFKGDVKLSCSGGPVGAKCANLPQTVRVNGTAYAISGMIFPKNTTPGTYSVTFTGVSGSLTNTATAKFTVK